MLHLALLDKTVDSLVPCFKCLALTPAHINPQLQMQVKTIALQAQGRVFVVMSRWMCFIWQIRSPRPSSTIIFQSLFVSRASLSRSSQFPVSPHITWRNIYIHLWNLPGKSPPFSSLILHQTTYFQR